MSRICHRSSENICTAQVQMCSEKITLIMCLVRDTPNHHDTPFRLLPKVSPLSIIDISLQSGCAAGRYCPSNAPLTYSQARIGTTYEEGTAVQLTYLQHSTFLDPAIARTSLSLIACAHVFVRSSPDRDPKDTKEDKSRIVIDSPSPAQPSPNRPHDDITARDPSLGSGVGSLWISLVPCARVLTADRKVRGNTFLLRQQRISYTLPRVGDHPKSIK
ncbi:hypothetical protein B0H65DRAFT_264909 [Neurospora tetraspora]|uniref:Uncharacterized protein n=1 Tax=Neurospora tetraspora TaxID=94610 RepID=A0AAE0JAV9_9PEZI|nr:hypothetical protein B0H65DRAFT_264909 [Neurospora tetraspora]